MPSKETNDVLLAQYQRELQIDRDGLDEALIRQPQLIFEVSEARARAVSYRDGLKDDLKRISAEAIADMREEALKEGKKVTETQLAADVNRHPAVVKATREYNAACFEADQWEALKQAFHDRTHILRELADLWIAGYFTSSSVRASSNDVRNQEYNENRAKLREARQRLQPRD